MSAQDAWPVAQRCLGLPVAAPDAPFPGMLVTIADDAVRAYREGVPTTYVLSFAGGNFLRGASVAPDGRHIAVPNGVITTVTSSDIRYTVQEIRIVTTETVPRITVRIPWRASFPVGSPFTSAGDIPPVQWLDGETVLLVQGTLSEEQTWVTVNPFHADALPEPAAVQDAVTRSPDGSRAVVVRDGDWVLVGVGSAQNTVTLPSGIDVSRAVWSPTSSSIAVPLREAGRGALAVFDAATGARSDLIAFERYQAARSVRWSPDGLRLAFALFDPQTGMNRLHVAELATQRVVDLCVELGIAGNEPNTSAVVWSPDGNSLAMVTAQAVPSAVVSIADIETGQRWTLLPASGELLGWYD
ncbi:MAG: PD40 domain-containing protein [Chloroflexi bacterium]|nr:PD40 domain-containing protein [Chloroflexota bacterium]